MVWRHAAVPHPDVLWRVDDHVPRELVAPDVRDVQDQRAFLVDVLPRVGFELFEDGVLALGISACEVFEWCTVVGWVLELGMYVEAGAFEGGGEACI